MLYQLTLKEKDITDKMFEPCTVQHKTFIFCASGLN